MIGTKRSQLRPGMRVAIVLKQDQATGRQTIGEIASILTPSENHHRGIKVRLRDGSVGRVQAILANPAPQKTARKQIFMGILLVHSPDDRWYCRIHSGDGDPISSRETYSLGIDFPLNREEARLGALCAASLDKLKQIVCGGIENFKHLLQANFETDLTSILVHVYSTAASAVNDVEVKHWSGSAWISREELQNYFHDDRLSPESGVIAESIFKLPSE